jgi:hypothetical protein
MSEESEDSTFLQSKAMKTAHLQAFWTQKLGFTGITTWIIQIKAKTIVRQMLNLI